MQKNGFAFFIKQSLTILKEWAKQLKKELDALRIALAENLVPWYVKILILFTVAYAFSPIDLIPDFIPVLGLLDDLIIVPLLVYITVKLIPRETMDYCRKITLIKPLSISKNWIVGVIIILLCATLIVWIAMSLMN